jgi:serine O-acetyltransferase
VDSASHVAWKADLARYPKRPFLKEQSIWAIALYRFGKRLDAYPNGIYKKLILKCYWILFRIVETVTGVSLPKSAELGPGLRIWHFGNIFIHPNVVIGSNCTLRQGVTIGNRYEGSSVPIIGDNVEFGAYAQVLGGVKIGNNCKVGAMSVVLDDIPDGCTAVGIPARVISTTYTKL